MKLHILSDVHNEFSVLEPPETDADVVILAGDIDVELRAIPWALQFKKPVIYLLGNHEFYKDSIESVKQKTREMTRGTNIHFLDDEEVVIDGVRFLGGTLWTDFKLYGASKTDFAMLDAQFGMADFKVIQNGPSKLLPVDTQKLHEATVGFLTEAISRPFEGKTVVVTHHAPSPKSIHPQYQNDKLSPGFASNLEHLMGEPVCLWVHGHVHHFNDYEINGTRVVSNPRGYTKEDDSPERSDFEADFIVEI